MEFEIGGTYKFDENHGQRRTVTFKFLKNVDDMFYRCEVVDGSPQFADEETEEFGYTKLIHKRSVIFKFWSYKKIHTKEETFTTDTYGKNVRINYKDPQLLDLFIEMALQTGDRQWFNKLVKAKREVSA